jgi:hypothetical protein
MSPRGLVKLIAFGELLLSIGSRRVEQAILAERASHVRIHQRLRNQARHQLDDFGRDDQIIRRYGFGGSERETPGEHG